MSPSIRLNLILFIIAPLALILLIAVSLATRYYENYLERRMQEDVELVARALQLPMGRAVEQGHDVVLERALESVSRINRVFGFYVYDAEGELLSSSRGIGLDAPRLSSDLEVDQQRNYADVSGRRVYNYFVPLLDSGNRVIGMLHVTRRASEIDDSIATLRWRGALLALIIVVTVSAMVVIGHRAAIGRPLHHLRNSMRRVTGGHRTHRAEIEGPAEIREVAQSLNEMLDGLDRAEHEIIEQKEAQWRLKERLKHAEKLAAIGQLAAGVAHELGTPLAVIDGKVQRALRRDDLGANERAMLDDIRAQVRRTETIVRQLLDFGRRSSLNIRSASPFGIAQNAVESLRPRAEAEGVRLYLDVEDAEAPIDVDPLALERVLSNLIDNGIDAAPGGDVRVRFDRDQDHFRFHVQDSGEGILPEDYGRVLEPFFTTKEVGRGTGLGLSVAHGIVEEHGGRLTVGASVEGGAVITVEVPLDGHN